MKNLWTVLVHYSSILRAGLGCVCQHGWQTTTAGHRLRESALVLVSELVAQMAVWTAAKTNRREVQRTEQGNC